MLGWYDVVIYMGKTSVQKFSWRATYLVYFVFVSNSISTEDEPNDPGDPPEDDAFVV